MKNKKIASLQSFFLPWAGVFNQVYEVDKFFIADNLQFEKKSWINRNRIKNINGVFLWLTVPLKKHSHLAKINEILIDNTQNWKIDHLKKIYMNYKHAPYFDLIYQGLKEIYDKHFDFLVEFNNELFFLIVKLLKIDVKKIDFESNYKLPNEKNSAIVELCKINNAKTYFSGAAAKCYLDYEKFIENDIEIILQNCIDVEYKQMGNDWVPKLSIIDTLFMLGPDKTLELIKKVNNME